jgi:hypothetical protein
VLIGEGADKMTGPRRRVHKLFGNSEIRQRVAVSASKFAKVGSINQL